MKRKIPFAVIWSGIFGTLREYFFLMVVGGAIFLMIGIMAKLFVFTVLGIGVLLMYLYLSIVPTIRSLQEASSNIDDLRLQEIIDAELHSQKKSRYSLYERVMIALDRETHTYLEEEESEDSETSEEAEDREQW